MIDIPFALYADECDRFDALNDALDTFLREAPSDLTREEVWKVCDIIRGFYGYTDI